MIQNKDILTALRTNFDKPEQMKELYRRLQSEYFPTNTPALLYLYIPWCGTTSKYQTEPWLLADPALQDR